MFSIYLEQSAPAATSRLIPTAAPPARVRAPILSPRRPKESTNGATRQQDHQPGSGRADRRRIRSGIVGSAQEQDDQPGATRGGRRRARAGAPGPAQASGSRAIPTAGGPADQGVVCDL